MAENSKIEWCDHTFNHVIGCTKVNDGCAHCYAESDQDTRRGRVKWGPAGTRSKTSEAYWQKPLAWNRACLEANRPRVFCSSLADVFEDWRGLILDHRGDVICRPYLNPENTQSNWTTSDAETLAADPHGWSAITMGDVRRELFALIDKTPKLDWLLLTKRPENIPKMWPDVIPHSYRRNVWIGASVSDQKTAEIMVPRLLECRGLAQMLFLSVEPLLGPVDLTPWIDRLDWVIVGGESGSNARPCYVESIRSVIRQCKKAAGTACFVKQVGANPFMGVKGFGPSIRDPKGGAPEEWPNDLRVREFPDHLIAQLPLSARRGQCLNPP